MRALVSVLFLFSQAVAAQPFQALDPDFFPNENNYGGPGIQTLNPDFFRSQKGLLPYADAGSFGCVSVWGSTAQAASARLGQTVQNLCQGAPSSVTWVPKTYSWGPYGVAPSTSQYSGEPARGHYQICCVKKGSVRRRRPGPR
jgi:hypothetical protein